MNPLGRAAGRAQHGATLLVSLIMLIVLTLFAVGAIRTGNIGLRIVGNQQSQKLMEAAAAEAVEQTVSNLGNFDAINVVAPTTTVAQRVCVNTNSGDAVVAIPPATCASGTQVDVQPARCIAGKRQSGGSLTQASGTYENTWEVVATVTDTVTGAKATYHQGVMIRMLATCPGLSS